VHEEDQAHPAQCRLGKPQWRRAENAGQFLQGVSVKARSDAALTLLLLDEGTDRAVVAIETAPGQVRYAGINADGKPLTAGPIQTDAKVFSVTVGPNGAVAHWLVEATMLNVDGKRVFLPTR
jgi:hypothetical protein